MQGIPFTGPGIHHLGADPKFLQPLDDVVHLGVAGIGAVLLKGQAKDDHIGLFGCQAGAHHLLDGGIRHKFAHGVIDDPAVENDLAVVKNI